MDTDEVFNLYVTIKKAYENFGISNIRKIFDGYVSYPKDKLIEFFGEDIVKGCIAADLLSEGSYDTIIPNWDNVDAFEQFAINALATNAIVTNAITNAVTSVSANLESKILSLDSRISALEEKQTAAETSEENTATDDNTEETIEENTENE